MITEYFLLNLRHQMDKAGLKDAQLSLILGKNKDIVNSWFRNKSKPNDQTVEELARYFNVERSEFKKVVRSSETRRRRIFDGVH